MVVRDLPGTAAKSALMGLMKTRVVPETAAAEGRRAIVPVVAQSYAKLMLADLSAMEQYPL